MNRDPDLARLEALFERPRDKTNGHGERPTILVEPGERPAAARDGLAAMAEHGTRFFRRYTELVRVARIEAKDARGQKLFVPAALAVDSVVAAEALSEAAIWQKPGKKRPTTIDPPPGVIAHVLALVEAWPFPPLRGIIATPTLRPDGSILSKPGYDPLTGLYLFDPPPMPPIADQPSLADAEAALTLLNELLDEFCFAEDDGISNASAIAMLMTPVLRGAMEVAPMFVVTKPEAGTGGSYLQDLAAMIATGERAPVLSLTSNPEENEKRLAGAALSQQPIIALDNVSIDLGGDFLCQVTERPRLRVRRLGTSELTILDNSFTVFANGNQLQTTGDVVRRTIRVELDANMENPDRRSFRKSPLDEIKRDRGRYVAAILTIARAYASAGYPGELYRPSYEDWSRFVRSALVWLNWRDPVDSVEHLRAADPIRSNRASLFNAWIDHLHPNTPYTTREIIEYARDVARKDLWETLLDIAPSRKNNDPDPTKLGQYLNKNLNTVAHGHKLFVDRSDKTRPKWLLTPL